MRSYIVNVKRISSLILCAQLGIMHAQYRLDASLLFGGMRPHSEYTEALRAPVYGLQIDADWELPNELRVPNPLQERKYLMKYLGATALVMDMGVPQAGTQIAAGVSLGAGLPLNKNLMIRWRLSHGLSYLTQKYDSTTTPINYAIGSHWNYLAMISADVRFTVNRFGILAGVNLTHCSNGNYSKPNVGLNALNMNVGVTYKPYKTSNRKQYYEAKKRYFAYPLAAGLKLATNQRSLEYPRRSYIWIADVSYRNQKSKFSFWDVGLDGFIDPNYQWKEDGSLTRAGESENYELAVRGGKVFLFGRLGLRLDLGMYIVKPYHSEKPWFYNAFGLDYRLGHHWVARSRLKAHLNKADYMEFGLSYLWN